MFRIAALLLLSIPAVAQTCTQTTTFNPAIQGQVNVCDAVPPTTTACLVSVAGESSLCRVNGVLNISENGLPYVPLFRAPVDVFKFLAPTNIVVSPTTTYYLGSLVALGHSPDMVMLAPSACTLNKIVYDARMSDALKTPITLSMWDMTSGIQIPNSAVTQTWSGVTVESIATPGFAVAANDQLQVRFFMPAGVPGGYYINLTVTAYCAEN